ncbi:Protein kinase, putative [Hondaea fermentalgiana]|uniref:Protein kinase, putative n=1 Tax=Hondaea fermentalgiana TaxID=2315210 RepID=A0A2R5G185_9STRA|nr:Protein kinase, putative [Hondaea fermentalgiana]|eukprot:GBG24787.1 Protein kinase, putative [Hondaea fermentalgiana]
MIAAKGRKLFSDFHIAQAEYAQEWGKSQGEEGVADLFQTEAPRLHGLYEIVRAEAAGVTAVVFRGKSLKTGQIVALKFVRIQVKGISDEARRKDCKEEARLQRLCAHENVVNLLDFEVGQKFAIFVLEYVDRTLLQKIVDSNENELYCERTAAKYIRDIALALQKCHARGVVHMDVKLDNILCTAGNVAKLCDFGVAEQMHHPNAPIHRHVAAPLFAPPEVHTLGLCDTAADMWSLGVVLYILLCGYPPFKETELKKRILHARYVFPERDWTQVSVMARDLVSRLLVLDVAQRFTADQVLAHPWIQALSTMPSRAEQPSTAPSTSASHTTSTDGGHFNSTKNSAIDKQNVDDVNDDVNNAANDADDDKEEDADEEEKKQRQIFSSAASAPLGGHGEGQGQGGQVGPFGPNTNVAATAEQDAGDENDEDDEDDGTESSESPLTEKDLLVQAKFKRRESIVSAAEGMSRPRPRRKSSSATKPPKATQAAPPPRSKRLVREKSFDVQPEEVMDWIDDSEAVSCRICDAEFTLFVRKHHCRNCSNLMCDSCSSHRRRLKILEVKEAVRVCKLCAAHLPNHR